MHPQDIEGASFRCLIYTIIHPTSTNIDIMYSISAISSGTIRKLDTPNPIRPPIDDQRFLELSKSSLFAGSAKNHARIQTMARFTY